MTTTALRSFCAVLALACLACAGTGHPRGKEGSAMESAKPGDLSRVDHVILGIHDLQAGIDGSSASRGCARNSEGSTRGAARRTP